MLFFWTAARELPWSASRLHIYVKQVQRTTHCRVGFCWTLPACCPWQGHGSSRVRLQGEHVQELPCTSFTAPIDFSRSTLVIRVQHSSYAARNLKIVTPATAVSGAVLLGSKGPRRLRGHGERSFDRTASRVAVRFLVLPDLVWRVGAGTEQVGFLTPRAVFQGFPSRNFTLARKLDLRADGGSCIENRSARGGVSSSPRNGYHWLEKVEARELAALRRTGTELSVGSDLESFLRNCRKAAVPRASLLPLWKPLVLPELQTGAVHEATALEILRAYLKNGQVATEKVGSHAKGRKVTELWGGTHLAECGGVPWGFRDVDEDGVVVQRRGPARGAVLEPGKSEHLLGVFRPNTSSLGVEKEAEDPMSLTDEEVLQAVASGLVNDGQARVARLRTTRTLPEKHGDADHSRATESAISAPPRVATASGHARAAFTSCAARLGKLAFICNIFARLMPSHGAFFAYINQRVQSASCALAEVPLQSLVVFCHSLAKSKCARPGSMRALGDALLLNVDSFNAQDMSNTWNAFRQSGMVHGPLFRYLLKRLPSMAQHFTAEQIGMTLNALGHFHIRHDQAVDALITRAKQLLGPPGTFPVDPSLATLQENATSGRSGRSVFLHGLGPCNLALVLNNASRLDLTEHVFLSDREYFDDRLICAVEHLLGGRGAAAGKGQEPGWGNRWGAAWTEDEVVAVSDWPPAHTRTSFIDSYLVSRSAVGTVACPPSLQTAANIALGLGLVLSKASRGSDDAEVRGTNSYRCSPIEELIFRCSCSIVLLASMAIHDGMEYRAGECLQNQAVKPCQGGHRKNRLNKLLPPHRFQFFQAILCVWHFGRWRSFARWGGSWLARLAGVIEAIMDGRESLPRADRDVTQSGTQQEVEELLRFVSHSGRISTNSLGSMTISAEEHCTVYTIDVVCRPKTVRRNWISTRPLTQEGMVP
ncbi:hypothetical protein CSUI_008772 [Cystoisospora suis]|uniref:Uncharacterized protein n=1 Tax=Cystoisospora suis TaxID=483139 RepID=A0A2C6KIL8_9APIC|nr:hypothetical protein CSUI_008772 [Cystoisospora suis]